MGRGLVPFRIVSYLFTVTYAITSQQFVSIGPHPLPRCARVPQLM